MLYKYNMPEATLARPQIEPAPVRRVENVTVPQRVVEELPIAREKEAIQKALRENDRIIVVGETGSGKTTMLPSFIQEVLAEEDPSAIMVVTQPRRLAARSVANFVASKLGTDIVGYHYKGESTVTDKTKINFTVDGSLLNELRRDPLLRTKKAVMVDEVHERSIDIDIELALLKRAQEERKRLGLPALKLIVASATLDQGKLANYLPGAASFNVEGRAFPIADHFSDHEIEREDIMTEAAKVAYSIVVDTTKTGDILIFMPGKMEIDKTISELERFIEDKSIELIPLMGGEQDAKSQDKIYSNNGKRKIIVSSAVAKTSITVPNVRHVILSGLVRTNVYDKDTGLTSLQTIEQTKADWAQERGRGGRTAAGDAYYLFTREQHERRENFPLPEVQRADLTALILRMKDMGIDDIHGFEFIDHPGQQPIDQAIETLKKLGALDKEGKITEIGKQMAELPLDPRFARMLVEAKKRGCAEAISILIGFLSNRKSVFTYNPRESRFQDKYAEFLVPNSDYLTLLNIWDSYVENNTDKEHNKQWTKDHDLSETMLYEATRTKNELLREELLRELGISRKNNKIGLNNPELVQEIHKCIAAGFMDQLLVPGSDGTYELANGRKTGIMIDRSSVLLGQRDLMIIPGSLRTQERTGTTFAGLNIVVDKALLKEVAPYLYEEERQLEEAVAQVEPIQNIENATTVAEVDNQAQEQVQRQELPVQNTVQSVVPNIRVERSLGTVIKEAVASINNSFKSFISNVKSSISSLWGRIKNFLKIK